MLNRPNAYPSIQAFAVQSWLGAKDDFPFHLSVDTQVPWELICSTITLEAHLLPLEELTGGSLMAILSNYATDSLVTACLGHRLSLSVGRLR